MKCKTLLHEINPKPGLKGTREDFLGGRMDKNSLANAGDTGSTAGPGRFHMLWGNWAACHNFRVCTLEPMSHNYWAHVLQLLKPICPRACAPQQGEAIAMRSPCITTKSGPHSPQLETASEHQQRPSTTINKWIKLLKKFKGTGVLSLSKCLTDTLDHMEGRALWAKLHHPWPQEPVSGELLCPLHTTATTFHPWHFICIILLSK